MANSQLNGKRKCRLKKNKHEKCKQRKVKTSNAQMKITNIPTFCLEHIFMYLELESLLNVADANKCLRHSTRTPFARKYGGKLVEICRAKNATWIDPTKKYLVDHKEMRIFNLKLSFQLLRCFGQQITGLNLYYGPYFDKNRDSQEYQQIFSYINKFCAESLNKVSFYPTLHLGNLKKPFSNVEKVSISEPYLRECDLNTCFPKLRCLRLPDHSDKSVQIVAQVYIPNLHDIKFRLNAENEAYAATMLRLNSQIKSFKIQCHDFSFLNDVRDYLQSLESLDINLVNYELRQLNECDSIYFQNVKRLRLLRFSMPKFPFPRLPLLFDQLEEFTLEAEADFSYHFHDFIHKNPTIKKLVFKNWGETNDALEKTYAYLDISVLENALPNLKEIVFTPTSVTYRIERGIEYMEKFKSLSKFSFHLSCDSNDKAMERYTDKYKISCVASRYRTRTLVTLERIEVSA